MPILRARRITTPLDHTRLPRPRLAFTTPVRTGAAHPSLLGTIVVVLVLALIAGGVLVARTFVSPASNTAAENAIVKPSAAPRSAESIEASIAAAAQYANNREYPKAEAVLRKAVEQYPQDQPLRLEFARVLVAQQKFAEAYPEYQSALALDRSAAPTSPASTPDGPPGSNPADASSSSRARLLGDPALQFEAGTIASKAGLLERAEEHYSMAQSGNPTDPRYPLFLGMVQLRLNKLDPAQASLIRSVTLDPSQSAAWGTLAELSLQNNQLSLALQHIEKARQIDPQAPRWRLVQAKALKRRQDKGDVEHAAQLLLAMDRSELLKPDAAATLAECYGLLARPADAAALYAEACRADATNPELAFAAAQWHQRAGELEKALRFAKTASMLGKEEAGELVKQLQQAAAPVK